MAGYPLIILGAGASYDSLENHNSFAALRRIELDDWKPPLSNDIFDRKRFDDVLNKYVDAKILDAEVNYRVNSRYSLEDLITDILTKDAPNDPIWYKRLMSFRLYIQDLFSVITQKYFDRRNNYYRLLSEINKHAENKACFVNFNYDLLLEKNIFDTENMVDVDEYVNGSLKVIKIHGACNWFRPSGIGYESDRDFKNGKEFLIHNAQRIFVQENNGKIEVQFPKPFIKNVSSEWKLYESINRRGFDGMVNYFIPDIALPVNKKRDFVCPETHIEILKKQLLIADRVVIIGWKAADKFLLDVLKSHIKNKPIFVVSHKSSVEISKYLKEEYGFNVVPITQGFSEFLKSGNCAKILSAENLDVLIQREDFKTDQAKIL